jgi:DNA-binding transcriptional ArsR family regulator
MSYGVVLTALADPTRRSILERLRDGERAAGDLGSDLPITQPAVSKHLRILREAGLVTERRAGTRRIYAVERTALTELQTWLEGFWTDALGAFKEAAEKTYEGDAT